MINANIKITSKGSGWQDSLTSPCTVEIDDINHIIVTYSNGGDACGLVLFADSIKMTRRGSTPLDMLFKRDSRTMCSAGEGALGCDMECFTTFLEIRQFRHGIRVKLNYTLSESPIFLEAVIVYA